MKVTLRERNRGTKISLYLDIYHKGTRKSENLGIFLLKEMEKGKLSKQQRETNKEQRTLAENIRAKRLLELQNGFYGFTDRSKQQESFIDYIQFLANNRKGSLGNYGNWDSALKHLKKYSPFTLSFSQVDQQWLEGFKNYLQKKARSSSQKPLSQNTQSSYFNKIRAALNQAFKEGLLKQNPAYLVSSIKSEDPERNYLTKDELSILAKTECEVPILKNAFLFSAITGLRWSDINKMVWEELIKDGDLYSIRFRQQKTKSMESHFISKRAFDLLGVRGENSERVFVGLKYSAWYNLKLQQWVMRAGIKKQITFHCARHTYATIQILENTDVLTLSKLLGHKDLKTTLIYAKVIDQKKIEAADRVTFEI